MSIRFCRLTEAGLLDRIKASIDARKASAASGGPHPHANKPYYMSGKDLPTQYHGGPVTVKQVDPARLQLRDKGTHGRGFYTTSSKELASGYAKNTLRRDKKPGLVTVKRSEAKAHILVAGETEDSSHPELVKDVKAFSPKYAKTGDTGMGEMTWRGQVNKFAEHHNYHAIKFENGDPKTDHVVWKKHDKLVHIPHRTAQKHVMGESTVIKLKRLEEKATTTKAPAKKSSVTMKKGAVKGKVGSGLTATGKKQKPYKGGWDQSLPFKPSFDNVLKSYNDASESNKTAGHNWYPAVHHAIHHLAKHVAKQHGISHGEAVGRVSAVFADYGAGTPFHANWHNLVQSVAKGKGVGGKGHKFMSSKTMKDNATDHLKGKRASHDIPSNKLGAYAHAALTGGKLTGGPSRVPKGQRSHAAMQTVNDRHMFMAHAGRTMSDKEVIAAGSKIWTNNPKSRWHYNELTKVHKQVARHIRKTQGTPTDHHAVQAVVWLHTREKNGKATQMNSEGMPITKGLLKKHGPNHPKTTPSHTWMINVMKKHGLHEALIESMMEEGYFTATLAEAARDLRFLLLNVDESTTLPIPAEVLEEFASPL